MNTPNPFTFFATLVVALTVFVGCESTKDSQPETSNKIPRLTLHLPKSAAKATLRMRELFDQAISNDPLPAPLSYEVKEVVHGTGAAAHSHYYLNEDGAENVIDDHGHETTGEIIHTVEVPLFIELEDLVKMLPNIAIVGKMPEKPWLKLKAISKELGALLKSSYGDDNSMADKKREGVQSNAEKISGLIAELESIVESEALKESE